MPPKSKAKKASSASEQSSTAEASQGIDKATTDSMLMIFEYCLSHGIGEIISSMSSPEFMDKYSLRAPIEQQLGLHLEFFLLRKSLQNRDFESAFSLWSNLVQSSNQSECSAPLAVRSFLAFASRGNVNSQGLRNHADIVLPVDTSSAKDSQHALARDKIDKVLSAKLGSPAFIDAVASLESCYPADSVAQQCLDVVIQHASALPRPLLEEMICHYKATGEHAARNAHPPPNIEIISASELVEIAGGADAFRKIWKCEHRDVQQFIDAKARMRAARGEAIIAQRDLQWHRVEASEASTLSAQVAAASHAVTSVASVPSQPSEVGSLKRGRAAAESAHLPSPPALRKRTAPEPTVATTPAAPIPAVQTASVRKALNDISARTKRLHSEVDPLADVTSARINARQATSTRVAFSDDEDAVEPKATSSWQPKGKLVTPAKPKVNPVPSVMRGPKGSMPWSDAEVNLLVKAIKEFGFGSWAKMKSKYKFTTPDRSEMQLKDKARNLVKSGKHTFPDNGKKSGLNATNESEFDL